MKSWRILRSSTIFLVTIGIAVSILSLQAVPVLAYQLDLPGKASPQVLAEDTLTIWCDSTVAPVLAALAGDFYAAEGALLEVQVVENTYSEFFPAAMAGGGPDIALVAHDTLGVMVEKSLLAPIDIANLDTMIIQSALDAGTYQGELYGLPWASENLGFFYNTDLVPAPPTTWNAVVSLGIALITSGDVQYGMSLPAYSYDAYPLMTAYGGYVFGKDLDGNWDINDLGINSPGMVAAVQWLADRVEEGFLRSETDWVTAHELFESGASPFIMAGPWALQRIRDSGVPYAIADFPSYEDQPGFPFMGVQVFVINANSVQKTLARTFLEDFVLTEATMDALYSATNRLPVFLQSIANITDPDSLKFIDISLIAEPMPNVPQMSNVWHPWALAVYSAMLGQQTPQEALEWAAAEILASYDLEGMVNVPGSYQSMVGCAYDWQAGCAVTAMTQEGDTWTSRPFKLPAGTYECKVALDGGYAINYGIDGIYNGLNIPFSLGGDGQVSFSWDADSKLLTIKTEALIFLPAVSNRH